MKALFLFCTSFFALAAPITHAQTPPQKAASIEQNLEQNTDNLNVPVIVTPTEKAKLASPLTGFIEKIHFKEGDKFLKDDILVDFDCTVLRSEKGKAQAAVNAMSVKAEGLNRLYKLDGASRLDVIETENKLTEAKEELAIKSYLVSQCQIKAPFNGQVSEVGASAHEYIEQGKPLMDIVNLSELELKLILPSDWLSWIKIGTEFNVAMKETALQYPAKILRLTYAIDPVSNTITAYAAFTQANPDITPGMSGNAQFKR